MEFNKTEAATLAGATTVEAAGPVGGEIDLYDQLITFSGLSPEEQLCLLAAPEESVEVAVEPHVDSVSAQDLLTRPEESVEEEEAVEPPDSDSIRSQNLSGPVEIEETAIQVETIPEPVVYIAVAKISEVIPEASEDSTPMAAAAAAPVSHATAQSSSGSEPSPSKGKTGDLSSPGYDRSRTGPLLAGLNVLPEFVFAGDLSLGVCLACGAESGADDLFCVSCGLFIDEIGSTPKSSPTCAECGQKVIADEIFCPWCGAAPKA